MISGHGGNIYELAGRLGCDTADICDMSANVNPLGPMPSLVSHLQQGIQAISTLPEVNAEGIIRSFSNFYRVNPNQVLAGNGTTELIYLIPRAVNPSKALIVGPTYADYKDSCKMNKVPYTYLTCKEKTNFRPDLQDIKKAAAGTDIVFFCNPNNPTGTMVSRPDLMALCKSVPDTLFVIDESYLPFVPEPEEKTLMDADLPNVLVLNSMSKAFRIPGLRIGFVKAPKSIIEKMRPYTLPWSVNGLAQEAVSWLMSHAHPVNRFLHNSRDLIDTQRSWLVHQIKTKTQIRCFPSVTSFILMRLPKDLDAQKVWHHMAENRILIRNCSNFEGLTDRFIRISLKQEKENRKAANLLIRVSRESTDGG